MEAIEYGHDKSLENEHFENLSALSLITGNHGSKANKRTNKLSMRNFYHKQMVCEWNLDETI